METASKTADGAYIAEDRAEAEVYARMGFPYVMASELREAHEMAAKAEAEAQAAKDAAARYAANLETARAEVEADAARRRDARAATARRAEASAVRLLPLRRAVAEANRAVTDGRALGKTFGELAEEVDAVGVAVARLYQAEGAEGAERTVSRDAVTPFLTVSDRAATSADAPPERHAAIAREERTAAMILAILGDA